MSEVDDIADDINERYVQYANVDLTHIKNPLDTLFEVVRKVC